jgi:excisionase family DNA binding protein
MSVTALPMGHLVTVPEAAALRGVHKVTIYRWIKEGRIQSVNVHGRLLLVPRAELECAKESA